MMKDEKRNPASGVRTQTTVQSLGALLKSDRDSMRKDKGLNGDLDRLPMLTWIMLRKFLDDLELQRENEAKLAGKKFKPAIEPPYPWRDWAAQSDGITGDELIPFNAPVHTCRQRQDLRSSIITRRKAREILNDLLEKYASDGELQFTLPDVLKVPPISQRGNVNEMIGKFGGADQLLNAVNQLQSLLYAAYRKTQNFTVKG
jgi:hypothetical protein